VEGYENGSFGPDQSITRAEFATLVVRALGLSAKMARADFSDVTAGDWYANAIAVAADAGIVNGYEDVTFRPNAVTTREELAAMVVRASAYAGTELSVSASKAATILAGFSDANSIAWAKGEIAAAANAGLVTGFEAGTVRAADTATRAQASAMIQRFLVNADFINE
jgi:N-acetylmuramoyl-L-alanine amidase